MASGDHTGAPPAARRTSMPSPSDLDDKPNPYARRNPWGQPPQAPFRLGPLPKAEPALPPPAPTPPVRPSVLSRPAPQMSPTPAGGILTGGGVPVGALSAP